MKSLIMLGIIPLLVLAPTLAFATNESSYRDAFKSTFEAYKCVQTGDCDSPSPRTSDVMAGCSDSTNMTACLEGTINGWKAWCKTNVNYCLDHISYGYFPDVHSILKESCIWGTYTRNATTGYTVPSYRNVCSGISPSSP